MGHCPWTLFTQSWVMCSLTFLECARFWECTLVQLVWVGGWPFWWQLGLWVRGWESSMSTLWTDHFTPRIFVLLAFPVPSILAVSPPSTLGGSILHTSSSNICIHSLYFTAPIHECFDYWRVILIYNSVTWVCGCVWWGGLQKLFQWRGVHEPVKPFLKSTN